MRKILPIGGALLALAAFASTADARMMGGGGLSTSPSMTHGDVSRANVVIDGLAARFQPRRAYLQRERTHLQPGWT